jgi:Tol biopolymer transport system component
VIKIDNWQENEIQYFAWSPDGKTLATVGFNIFLRGEASGKIVNTFAQDMGLFSSIAWSSDGSNLLAAIYGLVKIIDAGSGAIRVQIKSDENNYLTSAAFSPDGKIIATGGNDINLYNAQDGKLLKTLSGNADYADRLAFSPDDKTLASGSADGTVILWKNPLAGTNPKNGESNGPSISADGRLIVFTSQSKDLVDETLPICPTPDGQGIPCPQVYLFDRQTGSMELISRGEEGKPANGPTSGMISRDGQKVLLVSQATNLSSQGQSGLYLLDRATRAIKFVGAGGHPALSGDGRLVVFEKTNQKMSFDEIYLYDDQAGTTQNLSNGSSGENADGESMLPAISADDQWVAFWSWSSQIVTKIPGKCTIKGPNASCGDVYLKNLRTGKTDRIAVDEPYGEGMISYPISLSNDARWVAFKGAIYDHQTGEPILQYCLPEINCAGGALSRDGQWVVYAKAGDIFIQNRSGGRPEQASVSSEGTPGNGSSIDSTACANAPGCSRYPSFDLSADGSLVVFDSTASNLVPGDNRMCDDKVSILHNCQDIFLRDRQTGKTEWISKP